MKAVILAGGEGTRLRPLTLERPKPMTPLFGRPVLEHLLLLLRRNGISEAAVALGCLPQCVRDYFGDGAAWGMELHYCEEREKLGTAGAVRQAADFAGEEDVLVLPGDCVCDFELKSCIQRHRERRAAATILLHREREPLDYGLVQLDEDGKVTRFVEKPGWGQVFTNLVNTGIYILSPDVVARIPAGEQDFARQLFPALLAEGVDIYGDVPYGYWRDMGDTAAYLQTAADALDGKVKLNLLLPQVRAGVWSASPLPESTALVPPCWIGERVTVGEHCLIGPHTVLEQGSFLGDRVVAQRTVLLGAAAGSRSTLHGAILCEDASAGEGCTMAQGSVLGAQAVLGDHAMLREEVRIWPRIHIEPGSRLSCSVTDGAQPVHARFESGAIRGRLAQELTAELLLALGSILGRSGRVALGATPGTGSAALLMAAAAGVSAAGGVPWVHDGTTWGAAAWLAAQKRSDCGLFVEIDGRSGRLWVFGGDGLPLSPDECRRIEGALRRQEIHRAPAGGMGRQEQARGIDNAYCTAAVVGSGHTPGRTLTVCVPGEGRENTLLRRALEGMGCRILRQRRRGAAAFWTSRGGRLLFAEDERGAELRADQLLLLSALLLVEDRGANALTAAWDAPAAMGTLAEGLGVPLVPLETEEGRKLAPEQLALRDGIFAACLICRRMGMAGERLAELGRKVPAFGSYRGEVELDGDRGAMMEELSRRWPTSGTGGDGMRFRLSGGWVWLHPAADRPALRVRTEGENVEFAAQLCDFVCQQAKRLDEAK